MLAMNRRFRFDVQAIQHFMASRELGDVLFVRSVWLTRGQGRPKQA